MCYVAAYTLHEWTCNLYFLNQLHYDSSGDCCTSMSMTIPK